MVSITPAYRQFVLHMPVNFKVLEKALIKFTSHFIFAYEQNHLMWLKNNYMLKFFRTYTEYIYEKYKVSYTGHE